MRGVFAQRLELERQRARIAFVQQQQLQHRWELHAGKIPAAIRHQAVRDFQRRFEQRNIHCDGRCGERQSASDCHGDLEWSEQNGHGNGDADTEPDRGQLHGQPESVHNTGRSGGVELPDAERGQHHYGRVDVPDAQHHLYGVPADHHVVHVYRDG